jgi:S-sulfo-L-cysteine synthase (O-acetyl-L-serine-dependent)
MNYPTIEDTIGKTPLVRLQRIDAAANAARGNVILGKLEGNNPAGSVKDRPALNMIAQAEARGRIKPGDTLIEATSGNTGIALAMAAAIKGYTMLLIMPDDLRCTSHSHPSGARWNGARARFGRRDAGCWERDYS